MFDKLLNVAGELHHQIEELHDTEQELYFKTVMVLISTINELYKHDWINNVRIILGYEKKDYGHFFCFEQIQFQLKNNQLWLYRDNLLNPWRYYQDNNCYPFEKSEGFIKNRMDNQDLENILLTTLYAFNQLKWSEEMIESLIEKYPNILVREIANATSPVEAKLYYFSLSKDNYKEFGSTLCFENKEQYWKEFIEANLPALNENTGNIEAGCEIIKI
jgi:hypothetical protein